MGVLVVVVVVVVVLTGEKQSQLLGMTKLKSTRLSSIESQPKKLVVVVVVFVFVVVGLVVVVVVVFIIGHRNCKVWSKLGQ